jgi:hypothetical protein
MRGWRGYFGFCETPEVLVVLTRWVRCGYGQLFGASGKHHGVVERPWLRCESQGSCATRPVAALALGLSHGAKPFASGSPMPTSNRTAFHVCLERVSATSRTGRIRTRTYGGVGGAEPRGSPLSRSHLDRPWRATSIFHDSVAGGHASAASSRRKPPPSLDASVPGPSSVPTVYPETPDARGRPRTVPGVNIRRNA